MRSNRIISFLIVIAMVLTAFYTQTAGESIYINNNVSNDVIVIDENTDIETLKDLGLEGSVLFESPVEETECVNEDIDSDDEVNAVIDTPMVYPSNTTGDVGESTKGINPDAGGIKTKVVYTHAQYKANNLSIPDGEWIYASTYNDCVYFYIDERAEWTINGVVYLCEPIKIVSGGHLHLHYGTPASNGEVKLVKNWDTGLSDDLPMFIVEAGGQLTISGKAGEGVLNSSTYTSSSTGVDKDRFILTGNDTGELDKDQGPIIRCESGTGETKLKLYGVEFRNNRNATINSGNGGAIRLSSSFGTGDNNLIINKCRFNNIEANNGAAIYFSASFSVDGSNVDRTGAINLQNNVFINCTATDCGGGIMFGSANDTAEKNRYSSVNLSGSYFSNCTSTNSGGGIAFLGYSGLSNGAYGANYSGTINLDNCQFQTCVSTSANGGGIVFLARCNIMTLNSTVFNNCSAGGGGSAIYLGEESVINNLTATSAKFTNNHGATANKNYGGAFRTVGLASINATLTNCTFSGNTSTDGAAIYWNSGRIYDGSTYEVLSPTLTIDGCNIYSNTATEEGGGIYNESKMIITNTKIYSNKANNGAGICMRNYNNVSGHLPSNLSLTLDATTQIYSNTASVDGGGICFILRNSSMEQSDSYVAGSVIPLKLILTGAKIYSNTATGNGGGISFKGETGADLFYAFDIELNSGSIYSNTAANGGGIHAIANDRVINVVVNGGVIGGSGTPNKASNQGGGVCLGNSYITLDMSNGEISYNTATTGGGVYSNLGTVLLNGGVIHHNAVTGAGGGTLIHGGTATITGGHIYSNSALNGGGMYIRSGATVTMTGGVIGGDSTSYANYTHATDATKPDTIGSGGGIYIYNGAAFTMNGGSIKHNHSGRHGGGIYCNSANAVMNDGSVIDYNIADSNGGGIYARIELNTANISRECKITYNGGSVSYNKATSNGGGIYVENGTVDFYGGNIEWNETKYGGGVYTNNSAVANLKDDVSISYNTATQSGGGIYATTSSEVTVENGKINNNTASIAGGGVRVARNSKFSLKGGAVNGNVCNGGTYQQTGGGGIYVVGGTVTNADGTTTQEICTLIIEGGEISGNTTNYIGTTAYGLPLADGGVALYCGGGLFIGKYVTFEMNGGTISDNTSNRIGGGIYVRDNTVPLNGGTVGGADASTGNEAVYGGGIYACMGSTVSLTGGAVTYNTASQSGGGIYADGMADATKASITLSGGNVANNTATSGNGGGIYASYAKVSLPTLEGKSANVCDNTANQSGGGIYAIVGSTITLGGGDIYNNTAANGDGGGIFATNDASISVNGGDIYFNHAELGRGGGIYAIGSNASVTINGGNVGLSDYPNIANYGGGVYIDSAKFVLEKTATSTGSISYNIAIVDGGGGYFYNTEVNIKGNVSYNEARGNGGGIYLNSATVNLYGDLTHNDSVSVMGLRSTVGSGGGAYLTDGAILVIAEGGNITDNTTHGNGGGIAVYDGSTAQLNGGYIKNNSASNGFGGGVYANGSTVTIAGSDITTNSAKNGGGVCATAGGVLTMTGGYLRYNTAKGTPDSTVETAYHLDDTLAGVGGGIYLSNGVDANLMSSYELTGVTYGIYGNLADFAADDVFANGVNTRLYLPAALSMKLEGTEYERATGWFEDYANGDIEYDNATALQGNLDIGGERYRQAERTVIAYINSDDAGVNASGRSVFINTENAYVCLTLGVAKSGHGEITITKSGSEIAEDQMFVFLVSGITDAGAPIEFKVSIQGTGSVNITDVPDGRYTITEISEWSWRYEVSDILVTNGTVSIAERYGTVVVGAADASPDIEFINYTMKSNWLDGNSEPVKNVAGVSNNTYAVLNRFVVDMPRREELL